MKKKRDYFELIMKIIIVIFAIIVIYMIILKLIGRSPSLSEINFGIIAIIISSMTIFVYKFGRFQGKVEEFMVTTKNSFVKIKEDMNSIKNDVGNIKANIIDIKNKK